MKKFFKRLRFRIKLKNKHVLAIMTMLCMSMIVAGFASDISIGPLRNGAGMLIVPFEKSINQVGIWLTDVWSTFQEKDALLDENQKLQERIDVLTSENNLLLQGQTELTQLKELYQLDEDYSDYPKVAAQVISKDPGNWYSTFMINRGSNDGIAVDHNVIAGKGLVGIVTEVGPTWATVRSIIDDSSNVSAETVSTTDACIVEGDLELIDSGQLRFSQLYDEEDKVTVGERIVTSHISPKYVQGLFIGYVSQVEQDSNNLTKKGTIVSPVDFRHLKNVFVITMSKADQVAQQGEEAADEE